MSIARWAAVSVGLGLIFAWFGVYETGQIPFPQRVGYWTLLMALGAGCSVVVAPLVFEKWFPTGPRVIPIALASVLISIPITAGIVLIEALGDGTVTPPAWWAQQYLYVLVVSAVLTTGAWAVDRFNEQKVAAGAARSGDSAAGLRHSPTGCRSSSGPPSSMPFRPRTITCASTPALARR